MLNSPGTTEEHTNAFPRIPPTNGGREFTAFIHAPESHEPENQEPENSLVPHGHEFQKPYQDPRNGRAKQERVRIGIRLAGGHFRLIDLLDVVSVTAQGNYVLLQEATRSHILRNSIQHMDDALRDYGFIRIHRSVLINSALVLEVQSKQRGKYSLRTIDGKQHIVSRTYMRNLQQFASIWIGNIAFLSSCPENDYEAGSVGANFTRDAQ